MTRQATCHPERPYHAKGLCEACYGREYMREYQRRPEVKEYNREYYQGKRPPRAAKNHEVRCHPDLPRYAKGWCKSCYMREHYRLPEVKVRYREQQKAYAQRPKVKARTLEYNRLYYNRPEAIAHSKEYQREYRKRRLAEKKK